MNSANDFKKIIVVKLGGHAMIDESAFSWFMDDIKALIEKGIKFVIVHGGGPYINNLLNRLNLKSSFLNGLRVTDSRIMEAVEMALCAHVNKDIVRNLEKAGMAAVGISGQDGNLLLAEIIDRTLGAVGKIIRVNPEIIYALLKNQYLPVIAPVAINKEYEPLNVNADTAAGAIAGALKAAYFVLYSDVPGILDENKKVISKINKSEIDILLSAQVIHGGMIPKTECCLHALNCGCNRALILDARQPESLFQCLINNENPGTIIEL